MQSINNLQIRPITEEDISAVISIYKNGWIDTYPNEAYAISETAVQEAVEQFRTTTIHRNKFVAEIKGEIVGVISVKEGSPCCIQSLYVARTKRGAGVGTALMRFVFEKFGNQTYILQVAAYNERAIEFYKRFGFEIVEDSLEYADFYNVRIPQITMKKARI